MTTTATPCPKNASVAKLTGDSCCWTLPCRESGNIQSEANSADRSDGRIRFFAFGHLVVKEACRQDWKEEGKMTSPHAELRVRQDSILSVRRDSIPTSCRNDGMESHHTDSLQSCFTAGRAEPCSAAQT
ncbi:hypothetical protein BH11VER1_BH11VER1_30790 [soil metagenome]